MRWTRGTLRFLGFTAVLFALARPAYCQLIIPPSSPPDGIVGQSYLNTIFTAGGNGPTAWTIIGGSLPPGINLSPAGPISVDITGTPTAAGNYSFVVQAVDSGVPSAPLTATQKYTIRISDPLSATSGTLPSATQGMAYVQQLQATGGILPYTWTLGTYGVGSFGSQSARRFGRGRAKPAASAGGSLPPGLMMSSSGQITGTPIQTGSYTFDVTVNDSSSTNQQFTGATITIVVNQQNPLLITSTSPLPSGTVGRAYSIPLHGQGGSIPYTWSLTSGTIPPGLTLGSAGSLTGTPTQAGDYTFTLTLTDASNHTVSAPFTLTIASTFAITTPSPLTPGAVGVAYSAQINVTATTGPYTFGVAAGSSLPAGLSLGTSSATPSGALSGTPTAAGNFTFTVVAADSANHNASQTYTLTIAAAPITIAPAALPDGTLGTAYSQQLTATGGAGEYVFSLGSGALPGGITLSSTGLLSGTPTGADTFSFVVSVSDSRETTVTQPYQLVIKPPPVSKPTVTGVGTTEPPAQQPTIAVELAQTYPIALAGTMDLNFASAKGNIDDPSVQFSTGGRTVTFTIPAGQTKAVFPSATFSLGTGTVAGTITLTLHFQANGQDVTPKPAPTQVITIAPQAPVITKVTATATSGGFEVEVTGFSNTREMVSATFTFTAASGTTLQGSPSTITVDQIFATWYNDPASAQYGSQFTFAQPFTISGNTSGIASVSVTLTNQQGTSPAVSASVP